MLTLRKFIVTGVHKLLMPILAALSFCLAAPTAAAEPVAPSGQVELRVNIPQPGSPDRALYDLFLKENPDICFTRAGGIKMEGTAADASFFMSMVGGTAPDIYYTAMENVETFHGQGFLYPIDELAGTDDALLKTIRDYVKPIVVKGGHVYALPENYKSHALLYRRDLFARNGLPQRAPADWDEFFEFALKAHDPENGVFGYAIYGGAWLFCHKIWEAGGEFFRYGRLDVASGRFEPLPDGARELPPGDHGGRLTIRSAFQERAGRLAVNHYRRLLYCQWAKDSQGNKLLFRDVDKESGAFIDHDKVESPGGSVYTVSPDRQTASDGTHVAQLRTGVAIFSRASGNLDEDVFKRFRNGKLAMVILSGGGGRDGRLPDFNQKLVGLGSMPVGPSGKPVTVANAGCWCVNSQIPPERKAAAWRLLKFICGEQAKRFKVKCMVENGEASYVMPEYLRLAGYGQYVDDVPKDWSDTCERMEEVAKANPNAPGWLVVSKQVSELLERLFSVPEVDVAAELARRAEYCDSIFAKATGETKTESMRPWVKTAVGALVGALFLLMAWLIYRVTSNTLAGRKESADIVGSRRRGLRRMIGPAMFMLPAVAVILMFEYLPLLRGSLMSFYDFRVIGKSEFVGIDNFVNVAVSPEFWWSMYITVKYMVVSLAIGFVLPIAVALMLDEIPRWKVFFRTVFYLPAVTSGLIIMLLWKELYEPTPTGLLNRLFMFIGLGPYQFLSDPNIALICVVIPMAWASAGPGSILYQAALKCVPLDLYEAAAVDGAKWYHKIRYVTIPTLYPLIIINFLGAFLGAMQGMGNILVMTGGGPDRQTQVIALEIFYNAYVYLKFGYAVALAWILGAMLLGVTALQMRVIKKVDFKAAEGN